MSQVRAADMQVVGCWQQKPNSGQASLAADNQEATTSNGRFSDGTLGANVT